MVTVSSSASPATTLTRGGGSVSSVLTFTRPHFNANPLTLAFAVRGSAALGTDYTVNGSSSLSIVIPASTATVTVPAQAFANAGISGWETAVITIDPNAVSTQVGITNQDRAFLRIKDSVNTNTDTDIDFDNIPDGWELSNMGAGYDPQVPNNPYSDDDHDGLDLVEEIALGTNPTLADAPPSYPSPDPSDYVPLTLRIGEAGKLPDTQTSCAMCHEVSVRVGPFMRTCPRNESRTPVSQDFMLRLLRGTNYPVQVSAQPFFLALPTTRTNAMTPAYSASYTAQILSSGNNIYPFLTDSNHILGSNLALVSQVFTNTATLYVPDFLIATDADRNGIVDFANRVDRTSTNQPFTFWINDDTDSGNSDSAADYDPTGTEPDSGYSIITCLRDLEDFTRLQFKSIGLPGSLLTNSGLQLNVYLTNIMGTPSIRLFHSVETNGGIAYLTNTTTATTQIGAVQLGLLTNGSPLTLSWTNWVASGSNQFLLPMIFEGVSTGQCVIAFGFTSNSGPVLAMSRPFYLNLQSVSNLYEHYTVGDDTTTEWMQIPHRASRVSGSAVFGAAQKLEDEDYILFVHGWLCSRGNAGHLPARLINAYGISVIREDSDYFHGRQTIRTRHFGT